MKKVLVLGPPGAGKSKLAKKLSESFNLPLIVLDEIYWRPNWQPMDILSFRKRCLELASKERWVMDGNFGVSFDERFSHADTVIYLQPSVWLCMLRQILRALKLLPGISRPAGCKERFNSQLFWYTLKFEDAHGRLIEKKMREEFPHLNFFKSNSCKRVVKELVVS